VKVVLVVVVVCQVVLLEVNLPVAKVQQLKKLIK
jgi:hypothetical protein